MTKSKLVNRSAPKVRMRAFRMVFKHQGSYEMQAAAIAAIAPKIGCIPQTLRSWVAQAEKDNYLRDGVTSEERDGIKVALSINITCSFSALIRAVVNKTGGPILNDHNPPKWGSFACRFTGFPQEG